MTVEVPDNAGPGVRARFAEFGAQYPWILLVTMLSGSFSALLAATIINVALPSIIGVFGLGQDQAQWLSTGFLAASTSAMLLNAWCVASFGARATFIAAMVIFSAGSLLGAASTSLEMLIIARLMQGVAAGLIQPLALFLIFQVFPEHRRGTAMGIFSLGVVLAPGIGPLLGGVMVDLFSWRFVFLATVPVALLAIPIAFIFMPRRDETGARPPFDAVGLGLLSATVLLLLAGLAGGNRDGWTSEITVLRLSAAGFIGAAFIWWESRQPFPVLNLSLFVNRTFLAGAVIVVFLGTGLYGSTYLVPIFVQLLQGYTPTASGVLMLPAGLAMVIGFPLAGFLSDRMDVRILLVSGMVLFGGASLLMAGVGRDTPFWTLAIWLVYSRIGLSLVMPTAMRTTIRDLPPMLLASGSGALNFLLQLGGAFGVNGLAVLLQQRTAYHGETLASVTHEAGPNVLYTHHLLSDELTRVGVAELEAFSMAFGMLGQMIGGMAQILAFRDCFFVVGVVFIAGVLLIAGLPRHQVQVRAQ